MFYISNIIITCNKQGGHSLAYGKFKDFSRTFNYLFQAYSSNDVPHHTVFILSYENINSINLVLLTTVVTLQAMLQ